MVLAGQCLRKKLDPTVEQLWSQCTAESLPFRDPLLQDGPRVLLGSFLSSSPALLLPSAFFFSTRRGTLEEKWISLGVQPQRSTSSKFIPTCDSGTGQRSAIMHRPGGLNEDQLLSPSD